MATLLHRHPEQYFHDSCFTLLGIYNTFVMAKPSHQTYFWTLRLNFGISDDDDDDDDDDYYYYY